MLLILSTLGTEFEPVRFWGGIVVFAAGMALAGTPATTVIVSSLPANKQGVASAVNDTSRELGAALGIAVLGSVFNDRYRSVVDRIVAGAEMAFVDGIGAALSIAAVLLVAAAVYVAVRGPRAGDER